jgi:ethanolaminephosphotransferase
MFNLVPHILLPILYGLSLEGPLPNWISLAMGLCYFLYVISDNCDGKQARRTETTSPLGMLLDHGLDSVTAVLNTIILGRIVQVGDKPILGVLAMTVSTLPFYHAIIEQYYTGTFVLPVVNGVDDGSIGYIIFCVLSGLYGTEFWQTEYGNAAFSIPKLRLGHWLLYTLLTVQIHASLMK